MKLNRTIILSFALLVIVAALYRIIPGRPYGFAPQWAMAVFAGAVIRDRKVALIIPVLSMLVSDLLYQLLYMNGMSVFPGFYAGQWQNYLLFSLITFVGFAVKKINLPSIALASLAAPTLFFLLSNFVVWFGTAGTPQGLGRPRTFAGLIMCYQDGIPFFTTSLYATLFFSSLLFGAFLLLARTRTMAVNR